MPILLQVTLQIRGSICKQDDLFTVPKVSGTERTAERIVSRATKGTAPLLPQDPWLSSIHRYLHLMRREDEAGTGRKSNDQR